MRLCFSESRCFGVMKNQASKMQENLLSVNQILMQLQVIAQKKFMKSKLQSLEFRIKVILCTNSVKCSRREQLKFKVSLIFALELKKGIFFNEIFRPEFNMILSKKQLTLSFNCSFLPYFSELWYKIFFIPNCKDCFFVLRLVAALKFG